MDAFLVLIETLSNQSFIFDTNKLREQMGASQLVLMAGTTYITEAFADVTGAPSVAMAPLAVPAFVNDATCNRPLESGAAAEIIIATSGKSLLLTRTLSDAQRIVSYVTEKVLREADGMDVAGVIVPFDLSEVRINIGKAVSDAHARIEQVRLERPSALLRHPRLPIVAPCAFSGRASGAHYFVGEGSERELHIVSHASRAKRDKRDEAIDRMKQQAFPLDEGRQSKLSRYLHNLDAALSKSEGWFAVVHADGNGLGQVFLDFERRVNEAGGTKDRDYIGFYRAFSQSIESCSGQAFHDALSAWPDTPRLVPLVVGGDDLTIVCEGSRALDFTRRYLDSFEALTKSAAGVKAISPNGLSACAGIALTKSHFPFHAGYELAEGLLRSAKQVKRMVDTSSQPCSALDLHFLYDSSPIALDAARERLTIQSGSQRAARLYGGPYVVSDPVLQKDDAVHAWVASHRYSLLRRQVDGLNATDDRGQPLLSSVAHRLRTALFRGAAQADIELGHLPKRHRDSVRNLAGGPSLFADDGVGGFTAWLDAMDVASLEGAK